MTRLQEWIHRFELGQGSRYLRGGLLCLTLGTLAVAYNWRSFHNLSTQEAMDAAQLARNLSEGRGYTTLFVRPLSLYLVKKRNEEKLGVVPPGKSADYSELKNRHPD